MKQKRVLLSHCWGPRGLQSLSTILPYTQFRKKSSLAQAYDIPNHKPDHWFVCCVRMGIFTIIWLHEEISLFLLIMRWSLTFDSIRSDEGLTFEIWHLSTYLRHRTTASLVGKVRGTMPRLREWRVGHCIHRPQEKSKEKNCVQSGKQTVWKTNR